MRPFGWISNWDLEYLILVSKELQFLVLIMGLPFKKVMGAVSVYSCGFVYQSCWVRILSCSGLQKIVCMLLSFSISEIGGVDKFRSDDKVMDFYRNL